jgi:mRNA interferase ChpB
MVRSDIPRCGDVYWIDPNPVAGHEMRDRHRFVVITPRQINALGVSMTVPITTGGAFARNAGLAVIVSGHETTGVAVCNQVRSFDIAARVRAGFGPLHRNLGQGDDGRDRGARGQRPRSARLNELCCQKRL